MAETGSQCLLRGDATEAGPEEQKHAQSERKNTAVEMPCIRVLRQKKGVKKGSEGGI